MQETPLREKEVAAGAVMGEWFGCVLPSRFAGEEAEFRAAQETIAVADKNYQSMFSFSGADRGRYLNAILTNDIRNLAPGSVVPALFLNTQGHILAELEIHSLPGSLDAISYALVRERLAQAFEKYIIMDDVTMTDETENWGAVSMEGPGVPAALLTLSGVEFGKLGEYTHGSAQVAGISCRILRRSPGGVPAVEFICARAALADLWDALCAEAARHGGMPIGYSALSALRLEAGIPWFSYDFGEFSLPQEAGLETSHISYSKGCYLGQEIVERVRSRGHLNRRLTLLEFSEPGVPRAGAYLTASGNSAGALTRAAWSPARGKPIAMGYVRGEFLAPGTILTCEGAACRVVHGVGATPAHGQGLQ